MALRHAILSSLSRGVPKNGYELNAVFSDMNERVWHASPSQVYSELTKLAKLGLIEVSDRNERGRTNYAITPAGLDEIRRWLTEDEPDHTMRDDALMRMLTIWVLDDKTARYLIEAEIAFQRRRQMSLGRKIAAWGETYVDNRVWRTRRALHDFWLAETNLMIDWLEGLLVSLEEPDRAISEIFDEPRLIDP